MTLDDRSAATAETRRIASAAPLWRRFVAWIVDCALAASPVAVVYIATAPGTLRDAIGPLAVVATIVVAIANDITLVARTGQSVGRRLCAISVLDSRTMQPPPTQQVVLRCFFSGGFGFGVGVQPFAFLPGFMLILSPWPLICYIPAILDRRWHRGLNDRWAHTVVIDLLA